MKGEVLADLEVDEFLNKNFPIAEVVLPLGNQHFSFHDADNWFTNLKRKYYIIL